MHCAAVISGTEIVGIGLGGTDSDAILSAYKDFGYWFPHGCGGKVYAVSISYDVFRAVKSGTVDCATLGVAAGG